MANPAGNVSRTRMSKAPLSPVPVFSMTMANVTRSAASIPDRLLLIGVAARFVELIVPLNRGLALPGAENATGPTVPGENIPCVLFVATTPFVICSTGSVNTTWTSVSTTRSDALVVCWLARIWLVNSS